MIRLHMSSVMLKIFPLKMIYNLLANVVFSVVNFLRPLTVLLYILFCLKSISLMPFKLIYFERSVSSCLLPRGDFPKRKPSGSFFMLPCFGYLFVYESCKLCNNFRNIRNRIFGCNIFLYCLISCHELKHASLQCFGAYYDPDGNA